MDMSTGHAMHSGMSMSPTATAASAMASATANSMGGHGGGMSHGGGSCKISMLWNWYTVDSCFIARSWHNTSRGMFAGSCIGVILLVMALEFLRRLSKEYDRYIVAQYSKSMSASMGSRSPSDVSSNNKPLTNVESNRPVTARFRPSILQQFIRATLHMLCFAVAYFVMLLAMYFNGYIIICIFIGAWLGYAVFGWESFNVKLGGEDRMQANSTVCCG